MGTDTPIQDQSTAPIEFANAGVTSSVVESLNFLDGKKVDHKLMFPRSPARGPPKKGI